MQWIWGLIDNAMITFVNPVSLSLYSQRFCSLTETEDTKKESFRQLAIPLFKIRSWISSKELARTHTHNLSELINNIDQNNNKS